MKCHDGPYFSDHAFHNVGLAPARVQSLSFVDADDHGARDGLRAALADPLGTAGAFSDMPGGDGRLPTAIGDGFDGAFRTPTLRCVSKRTSFMHTGQLRRLDGALGVVAFFNRGGDTPIGAPTAIGANELHSLGLSLRETADVVSFLQALDGPGPAIELLTPEAP